MIVPRMRSRRLGKSPHGSLRLPFKGRHVVAALLLLGSLPSLLVNVGVGRSVLLHDHHDEPLHAHVVATSFDHAHPHVHGEDHGDGERLPGSNGRPEGEPAADPSDRQSDGTKIRGSEITVSKKYESAPEASRLHPGPAPLILAAASPPSLPLLAAARGDSARALRHTELVCLRAVVLLI